MSAKKDSKITVVLAHGANVDGKYVGPGESITVTPDEARSLRAGGYVAPEEDTSGGSGS